HPFQREMGLDMHAVTNVMPPRDLRAETQPAYIPALAVDKGPLRIEIGLRILPAIRHIHFRRDPEIAMPVIPRQAAMQQPAFGIKFSFNPGNADSIAGLPPGAANI